MLARGQFSGRARPVPSSTRPAAWIVSTIRSRLSSFVRHGDGAGCEHQLDLVLRIEAVRQTTRVSGTARRTPDRRLGAVEARHPVVDHDDIGVSRATSLDRPRPPLATEATISISPRSPSSSSRVSLKTSLSSTIYPGDPTHRRPRALLGREEERIVRLSSLVHLDFEVGGGPWQYRRAGRRAAVTPPVINMRIPRGLGEQPPDNAVGDLVELSRRRPPGSRRRGRASRPCGSRGRSARRRARRS